MAILLKTFKIDQKIDYIDQILNIFDLFWAFLNISIKSSFNPFRRDYSNSNDKFGSKIWIKINRITFDLKSQVDLIADA